MPERVTGWLMSLYFINLGSCKVISQNSQIAAGDTSSSDTSRNGLEGQAVGDGGVDTGMAGLGGLSPQSCWEASRAGDGGWGRGLRDS